MESKKIFSAFFQYVCLNILGMLGLSCYILADTCFVSAGLGANGLTALNLAIPVYSFVHGCGLMLGMGGAAKYSVFRGQKEFQNANQTFTAALCLTVILSSLFLLTGIFFSGNLTAALHADIEVFAMTKTYLQVILLFAPAFMLNDLLLCFVRNDGNPKLSMAAMLTGSLSNIILDYLFIFSLRMEILGAVLATGFAPIISMCVLSKHLFTKQNQFHWARPGFSPGPILTFLSLGIPSLITEVASGIVMLVFNSIILRLRGNIGVAAYGIIANLSLVVTSIYTGIAQGMQPLTSRFYGYRKKEEIQKILQYAVITMLFISACLYFTLVSGASRITGFFNSETNDLLQQIAVTGMKLYFTAIPFSGFNIILSIHFISTQRALPAQVISLLRGFFLVIPMAFLLSGIWDMTGVWLSYPITEMLVCILGIILYKKSRQIA